MLSTDATFDDGLGRERDGKLVSSSLGSESAE